MYLLREPLCSCHNPHDLSSPPTESLTSTSFSWVSVVNEETRAQIISTGKELKCSVCFDVDVLLLADRGCVSIHGLHHLKCAPFVFEDLKMV